MRYAIHQCSKCDAVLPGDALTTVTDRVFTGTTYRHRVVNGGGYRLSGKSDHYSNQRRRLCPNCLRKRRLIQAAFIAVFALAAAPGPALLLLAAAVVLWAMFKLRGAMLALLLIGAVAAGAYVLLGGPLHRHHFGLWSPSRSWSSLTAPRPTHGTAATPADPPVGHEPRRSIRLAAPKTVVQPLPATSAAYPPCSATVTDHCVDR